MTTNNNDSDLGYVDDDSVPGAIDSSQADLQLPAGATILYATLQWGGEPGRRPRRLARRPRGRHASVPDGTPTVIHRTRPPSGCRDEAYSASVDVTALIRSLPSPNGTYSVADVHTGTGPGQFGGWSLVVAYRLPDCAAPGARRVRRSRPRRPPHPGEGGPAVRAARLHRRRRKVQVGVIGYEGDLGLQSDRATVGGRHAGQGQQLLPLRRSTWATPPGCRPRRTSTASTPSC